jgi:hypothetical protein
MPLIGANGKEGNTQEQHFFMCGEDKSHIKLD